MKHSYLMRAALMTVPVLSLTVNLTASALTLSTSETAPAKAGTSVLASEETPDGSSAVSGSDLGTETVDASEKTADESTLPRLTRDAFPVLDGSTSMVPLGKAIASALLGEPYEEIEDLISFNRTTQSFRNLMAGTCDVVIAAEPESTVFDEMQEAGFSCDIETIAKEALVFVVNEDNPVDSLTSDQIRKIYSGEITNWKEVGGDDCEITAFQRNSGAGSQVMMEKLVMQDTPMAEVPQDYTVTSMGELISVVKSYDNTASAIGYTVYYYANDMKMADGLKIISVDGVEPCAETLRDESYPYLNGYYCAIASSAEEGSPAREIYNWLMTEPGQYLLNLYGYVSVADLPEDYVPSNQEEETNLWSDFTWCISESGHSYYTRLSEGALDDLTASDSYGTIYPYAGTPLYYESEDYSYQNGYLWGFTDEKGTLLTDPVYISAERLCYYDYEKNNYMYLPFWKFGRVEDVTETTYDDWSYYDGTRLYGFASLDGSFVTDCCYSSLHATEHYILAVNEDETAFTIFDLEGNICFESAESPYADLFDIADCWFESSEDIFCFYMCDSYGDYYYYGFKPDGTLISGPYLESFSYQSGAASVVLPSGERVYVDTEGNVLPISGFRYGEVFRGDAVVIALSDGSSQLVRRDGTVLLSSSSYISWQGNLYSLETGDGLTHFYDTTGAEIAGSPLETGWAVTGIGHIFALVTGDGITLKDLDTGTELFIPEADYCYQLYDLLSGNQMDMLEVNSWDEETYVSHCWLVDPNLAIVSEGDDGYRIILDELTGENLVLQEHYNDSGLSSSTVLSCDGTILAEAEGDITLYGDVEMVLTDASCTFYQEDGSVLFRYVYTE